MPFADSFRHAVWEYCGPGLRNLVDWDVVMYDTENFLDQTSDVVMLEDNQNIHHIDRLIADRLEQFAQNFIGSYDFSDACSNNFYKVLVKEVTGRDYIQGSMHLQEEEEEEDKHDIHETMPITE